MPERSYNDPLVEHQDHTSVAHCTIQFCGMRLSGPPIPQQVDYNLLQDVASGHAGITNVIRHTQHMSIDEILRVHEHSKSGWKPVKWV